MRQEFEDTPGCRIIRRFDDQNRLVSMGEYRSLPDGKEFHRELDPDGRLLREVHFYPGTSTPMAICLTRTFHNGTVTGEQYLVKSRLASRNTYEKARAKYPAMPAADQAADDVDDELLRLVAADRKQRQAAARVHTPNLDEARSSDEWCRELMRKGETADATIWIKEPGNTLGEMNALGSRRLVARLQRLGCRAIIACEIQRYDNGQANTGHLVVELPDESDQRRKLLRALDRLAEDAGYEGSPDDGQTLAYIKLD